MQDKIICQNCKKTYHKAVSESYTLFAHNVILSSAGRVP